MCPYDHARNKLRRSNELREGPRESESNGRAIKLIRGVMRRFRSRQLASIALYLPDVGKKSFLIEVSKIRR